MISGLEILKYLYHIFTYFIIFFNFVVDKISFSIGIFFLFYLITTKIYILKTYKFSIISQILQRHSTVIEQINTH